MPLPLSIVFLVEAAFLVFAPVHLSLGRAITAGMILLVATVNEFLRIIWNTKKLGEPGDFYDIPAAPKEPVAHRDTPE